jgi:phosphatidylglycerophosphatase A
MSLRPLKAVAVKIIATFFYIGFLPVAPGTFGSAAGILIAWFLPGVFPVFLTVFAILGFWATAPARVLFKKNDPGMFVMDEVCGMMIVVCGVPRNLALYGLAFFFFRLFDILKPWPIRDVDRRPEPSAIMWDDILAGIFANVCVRLIGGFLLKS